MLENDASRIFGLVIVGVVGLWSLVAFVAAVRLLFRVAVTSPDALDSLEPGRAAVAGTLAPEDGGRVTAPLSGERCAGYLLLREVYDYHGTVGIIKRWQTHGVDRDVDPFVVDDGSASARVDPGWRSNESDPLSGTRFGLTGNSTPDDLFSNLRLSRDASLKCAPTERPPASVLDALGERHESYRDCPHRYSEWRLDPGDDLYVLGEATAGGSTTRVARRIENSGRSKFVVAEPSRRPMLLRLGCRAALSAVGAVGLLGLLVVDQFPTLV